MPTPLHTPRLLIELLTEEDAAAFVAYRSDPSVAALQSWSADYGLDDAFALIAGQPRHGVLPDPGQWSQLALRRRGDASRTLLGDVAVGAHATQPHTFELGVTVAREHQGQGLAREAVAAVARWLFTEWDAHRLIAQTDRRNLPMMAVFRALQWRHEGSALDSDWFKGEWATLESFALLDSEWNVQDGGDAEVSCHHVE